LVGHGVKQAAVFVNEGTQAIRLGYSGTVSTNGIYLDGGKSLADNYSLDDYWARGSEEGFQILAFLHISPVD